MVSSNRRAVVLVFLVFLAGLGRAVRAAGAAGTLQEPSSKAPAVISGFVNVGTAELAYDEAGQGTAIVMIHGGFLTKEMWDGLFQELAADHRVIRYDARNHGRSRTEKGTFAHYEDLKVLMDKLRIDKAVVMGLSMGGYVATELALKSPERVAGLILVAPGLSGYNWHGPEIEAFAEKYTAADASGDRDRIIDAFMEAWTYGPKRKPGDLPPVLVERVKGMMRRSLEAQNKGSVEARLAPLAAGRLGEIKAPTMAIVGDLDMPDILEIVDLLGTSLRDFEKVVIPGVAHMVNLERPDEFRAAVRRFLARVH